MEKYKEIERSIIKTYRKDIWSRFIKAVIEYKLINEGDNIMVCISGGKDSFLLAKCIQELQRHGKYKFNAHYGYNLRLYPLDYKDLKLEITFENGKKIHINYIFASTYEISNLTEIQSGNIISEEPNLDSSDEKSDGKSFL